MVAESLRSWVDANDSREYGAYGLFLAWVAWHVLTLSAASNDISLIEGHDAVLFTRKS